MQMILTEDLVMEITSNKIRKQKYAVSEIKKIESIIQRALICRLGLTDGESPYIIPLNFGYESGILYFHMSSEGRKIECIRKCASVAFEIDIEHAIMPDNQACGWDIEYECAMGYGSASFVEDREQKIHALNIIMKQYSDQQWSYPDEKVDKTTILQVKIRTISAKRNVKEAK